MKVNIKTSTSISNAWYDQHTSSLRVEFKSGVEYNYSEVPLDIIEKWETHTKTPSGSVGSFFHHNIRNAFPFLKEED